MIIWINGPFGGGKTHTAFTLKRRLHNAFVFDPENAGFYIRKNTPQSMLKEDFQDEAEWLEINKMMLAKLRDYNGIVIVPMTVTHPERLEAFDYDHHFTLLPDEKTLNKRLIKRGDKKGSFAFQQIPRCYQAFRLHETVIDNSQMTPDEVAELIAGKIGLKLKDPYSSLENFFYKIKVTLQHIRG